MPSSTSSLPTSPLPETPKHRVSPALTAERTSAPTGRRAKGVKGAAAAAAAAEEPSSEEGEGGGYGGAGGAGCADPGGDMI